MRFTFSLSKLVIAGACLVLLGGLISLMFLFRSQNAHAGQLVVTPGTVDEAVFEKLQKEGLVKDAKLLQWVLRLRHKGVVAPGGYRIPESVSVFKLAAILSDEPQMIWVTIPEGLRKEEIADIFSEKLAWDLKDREEFFDAPRMLNYPVEEGIYFPDTYLVDRDDNGEKVARRMINRFNEQIASYQAKLLQENIKWDTALKIASLVQREAGGVDDMPVIAAVIWNRLFAGMKLDVDATVQYIVGNNERGYWPRLRREDKEISSPYNTYKTKGLPPQPIANPGLAAIKAAIYPVKSKCLYYLHDTEGQIHCSVTYDEHQDNVIKYLR